MYQGFYGGGREYILKDPTMSDEEIARIIMGVDFVHTRNELTNVAPGTFWLSDQVSISILIAIRGRDGEIVLFEDFLKSHGRAMLSIADPATSTSS